MSKRSDKTRLTNAILKRLLEYYVGAVQCESCGTTNPPIDIAHSHKKSQCHFPLDSDHSNDHLWFEAGLLCRMCHREQEGDVKRLQAIISPRTGESMRTLAIEKGWYKV